MLDGEGTGRGGEGSDEEGRKLHGACVGEDIVLKRKVNGRIWRMTRKGYFTGILEVLNGSPHRKRVAMVLDMCSLA